MHTDWLECLVLSRSWSGREVRGRDGVAQATTSDLFVGLPVNGDYHWCCNTTDLPAWSQQLHVC